MGDPWAVIEVYSVGQRQREREYRENGIIGGGLGVGSHAGAGEKGGDEWVVSDAKGKSPERGTFYRDIRGQRRNIRLDQDEGLVGFDLRGFEEG